MSDAAKFKRQERRKGHYQGQNPKFPKERKRRPGSAITKLITMVGKGPTRHQWREGEPLIKGKGAKVPRL